MAIDYEYYRIAQESIKLYKKGSEWYEYYKRQIEKIEQQMISEKQLRLF